MLDEAEEARLDRLRRGLYRPGATDADRAEVERLLALRDAPAPDGPREPAPRRTVRRTALVLGGAGVALAVAAALLPRPAAPLPAATAASAPLPTPVEVSVDGTATTAQRFHGSGTETLQLVTGSAPPFGGRLVVVLAADGDAPIAWRATRPAVRTDHRAYDQVLATSAPASREGLGHPETAPYDGDPPAAVDVRAATGAPWTLTVLLLGPERG